MVAQAVAAIALGLLGASGVAKLVDPGPTTGAMRAARLPNSDTVTYGLGLAEITAAAASIIIGGIAIWVAFALYLAFTIFTFAAVLNRIPVQSCGCFGREDTPPNWLHVGYNGVAALALGLLALGSMPAIDWALPALELALVLIFTATGVFASYLVMTRLPQVIHLSHS